MTRYTPSRNYLTAAIVAMALAAGSGWFAWHWMPAVVSAVLFLVSGLLLGLLAFRPPIEIHPHHLRVGDRVIMWAEIQALDRTGWISPLVVFLTLADGQRILLVHPGDLQSSRSLLQNLCRYSREALIDGVPHQEFWGPVNAEAGLDESGRPSAQPRYPLLREDDEAEVERLYQRLKAVGHLDPKSTDES